MTDNHLHNIVEALKEAKTVLIATHIFPDGDALGSQLGLATILESMGKKVIRYSEEKASYLYDFLPESDKLITELPQLEQIDCVIALDCGDKLRLGKAADELQKSKNLLVIDHHAGHKNFGDYRWVESTRSSTGEMVYELSLQLGVDLSNEAAYCLYVAIVTDTGSFKYASTSARTFAIAGKLLEKGLNPEKIAGKLFDNFTESRLHLLQSVLSTLELYGNGKLAIITATKKMLEITGATAEDTETFINYPRSLATVKVAAFVKETDEVISVSMRSKGTYNVAEVARKLNGGGHRNAAGCKFRDGETLKEARDTIFNELLPLVQD